VEFAQEIYQIWSGFGAETKSALLNGVFTLLAAFFGVWAIIHQIRSQARESRSSLKENERLKLKAEMFEESVLLSRSVSDNAIALSTKLRTFSYDILMASTNFALDGNAEKIKGTIDGLFDRYSSFSNGAISFVYHVEKYRIIDPRILIFRTAVNAILHDCGEHHSRFFTKIMPLMPQGPPASGITTVSPDLKGQAELWANEFLESLNDIVAYIEDYLIEMQNLLLGDLFEKDLEHREPLDPNSKVVCLEKFEDLTTWFEDNTEWGKMLKKYEQPELKDPAEQ